MVATLLSRSRLAVEALDNPQARLDGSSRTPPSSQETAALQRSFVRAMNAATATTTAFELNILRPSGVSIDGLASSAQRRSSTTYLRLPPRSLEDGARQRRGRGSRRRSKCGSMPCVLVASSTVRSAMVLAADVCRRPTRRRGPSLKRSVTRPSWTDDTARRSRSDPGRPATTRTRRRASGVVELRPAATWPAAASRGSAARRRAGRPKARKVLRSPAPAWSPRGGRWSLAVDGRWPRRALALADRPWPSPSVVASPPRAR